MQFVILDVLIILLLCFLLLSSSFPLSSWSSVNSKFTGWTVNGRSPCGHNTLRSQCISDQENLEAVEMNLFGTTCTKDGFTCKNQKQFDVNKTEVCPHEMKPIQAMKIRHECPTQASKLNWIRFFFASLWASPENNS